MRVTIPTLLGLATLATAHTSFSNGTDCVSSYTQCLDLGGADNTCQSNNAVCKNQCSNSYGECLESGRGDCMSSYNGCLDGFTVFSTASNSAGKDCVSIFSQCHDSGLAGDNTCNAGNAQCKDKCSTIYGTCLTSGDADGASCMTQYNNCLDSFSVFETPAASQELDCVALFSKCHNIGTADNTCNSYNAQCKDKCSVIYGTCLSSGAADDSACMGQYNNCLDSFSPSTASSISCTSNFTMCLDSGVEANTCASGSAQCKDKCSTSYSTCLSSGDANKPACLSQYSGCLASFEKVPGSSDCVSKYSSCERDGTVPDNTCGANNAVCKTNCATSYSTCLSSGDSSVAGPCLKQYNQCLVSFTWETNTTAAGEDCFTKIMSCDGDSNTCSARNAQCKNSCSVSYDTCGSSGDSSLGEECFMQYDNCLVNKNYTPKKTDCASAYLSCDKADNDCLADLATCKNTCGVARDTCQTSGDEALLAPCLKFYDECLVDFTAAKSAIGQDCVATFLTSDGSNTAQAAMAQCKNKCAEAADTCYSSGDNSTAPACLNLYDQCLVSSNDTIATGLDCGSQFKACGASGEADNVCQAYRAACKNSCAVIDDACRSSGDKALVSMCDSIYNSCLDPVTNTNITSNATATVNSSASYTLPPKTFTLNATSVIKTASALVSAFPTASANGTGLAATVAYAFSTKSAFATLTASASVSTKSAIISPMYANSTTFALATGSSTSVVLPTVSAKPQKGHGHGKKGTNTCDA